MVAIMVDVSIASPNFCVFILSFIGLRGVHLVPRCPYVASWYKLRGSNLNLVADVMTLDFNLI
jgi:hypothetical protein